MGFVNFWFDGMAEEIVNVHFSFLFRLDFGDALQKDAPFLLEASY